MNKKTRTIYSEKYVSRAVPVMRAEAMTIVTEASQIFAVEQAEIEVPYLDKQRRLVVVMRFERIVKPEAADAVDPSEVSNTGTPPTRV